MYIVKFQGGLGNQMFQYAFMKALEVAYPENDIFADLKIYKIHSFHSGYELEKIFGIKVQEASTRNIIAYSNYIPPLFGNVLGRKLFEVQNKIYDRYKKEKKTIIKQCKSYEIDKLFFHSERNLYFDGYWQGEIYYKRAIQSVIKDFQFDKSLEKEFQKQINEMKNCNSVSVHVRRGDYVNNPDFDVLYKGYYKDAIKLILSIYSDAKFYFFSDDEEYCKKEFDNVQNKEIVHGNKGYNSYKDMFLMSRCNNNIIANSSFSYWGAELNANPDKIVIQPDFFSEYGWGKSDWITLKEKKI